MTRGGVGRGGRVAMALVETTGVHGGAGGNDYSGADQQEGSVQHRRRHDLNGGSDYRDSGNEILD